MSKFCGVWHFDSRPVSPQEQVAVRTALGSPGFVAPQEYQDPGLHLGWAAGSATPRDRGLFQSPGRGVCLWDGRLDNRNDLQRRTGFPPDTQDAAIVFSLYHQEGVDGLGGVVGDWSLCIWDAHRREIVLASDYAGIRPLYYHHSGHSLYWSSSLADLVRWTGITELDHLYAGRFLVHGSALTETPYARIFSVPPGHAVSITEDRIVKRAFWSLPLHQEIQYRDEREYEERMLELFRDAVRARMQTGTPVSAELSGGLDSSSIVCMADRLRREVPGPAPDLHTFSYTHAGCPDEKYFREVERACQLSGCHLQLPEYPAVTAGQAGASPAWWTPRFQELARRMAATGSGVLLTGQLGDFITRNTSDDSNQVTEWLAKGHLGHAAREAYAWGRSMQVPLYPILWRSIREACSSWSPPVSQRAAAGAIRASTEDSLAEGLRSRLRLGEEERLAKAPWRDAPAGRRRRFQAMSEILQSRSLQAPEALQHISYTHPFAHRPLVEFLLTIPSQVVCGPGQPRRLMRRAFEGLLPPMILGRKSKAAYTDIYVGALRPLAAMLLSRPSEIQLVERGYVDRQSLTGRLERFTQGLDCNQWQLRPLILFEFWLRNRMALEYTLASPIPAAAFSVS